MSCDAFASFHLKLSEVEKILGRSRRNWYDTATAVPWSGATPSMLTARPDRATLPDSNRLNACSAAETASSHSSYGVHAGAGREHAVATRTLTPAQGAP